MIEYDAGGISQKILNVFHSNTNIVLFAGAGVSINAGYPGWNSFLTQLADFTQGYDETISKVMQIRIKQKNFLNAALLYKTCPNIPEGEKYKKIKEIFCADGKPENLQALVSLPFSAIITTNFDSAIHNAYIKVTQKFPRAIENDDSTFRSAPFISDFFIARIHGRGEVPEKMIFDEQAYKENFQNTSYVDLLLKALTTYSCMFIGYSFNDPAIIQILELLKIRIGPNYPSLHTAFLPSIQESTLGSELAKYNISTYYYSQEYEHFALWEGIKTASRDFSQQAKTNKPSIELPLDSIKRFLASSYIRLKNKNELQPLRDLVIDGIIQDIIIKQNLKKTDYPKIFLEIAELLKINLEDAKTLVNNRLRSDNFQPINISEKTNIDAYQTNSLKLDQDLNELSKSVVERLLVRHGIEIKSDQTPMIKKALEDIILMRGWDLGASYAGFEEPTAFNLFPTITKIIEKYFSLDLSIKNSLKLSFLDLFQRPSDMESDILSQLGRVSFALHLIFNMPSTILSQVELIPQTIYLDANVILPYIVDGHPLQQVYIDAFSRLNESGSKLNLDISIFAISEFLNEVIAHKNKAQILVNDLNLEDVDELENLVLRLGADNTNVYIGGYGSFINRNHNKKSFKEYLDSVAPYKNEKELCEFLQTKGIQFVTTRELNINQDISYYIRTLESAYINLRKQKPFFTKDRILLEHEAKQLAILSSDIDKNIRSLFITMDENLRMCAIGKDLGKPGNSIISHRGFIQMIDLLFGISKNSNSMARLYWGSFIYDEDIMLRNYFTNIALKQHNDLMAMTLPEVLEKIILEVKKEARHQNISLEPCMDNNGLIKQQKFLDRFEDKFYEYMEEAIKKKNLL